MAGNVAGWRKVNVNTAHKQRKWGTRGICYQTFQNFSKRVPPFEAYRDASFFVRVPMNECLFPYFLNASFVPYASFNQDVHSNFVMKKENYLQN